MGNYFRFDIGGFIYLGISQGKDAWSYYVVPQIWLLWGGSHFLENLKGQSKVIWPLHILTLEGMVGLHEKKCFSYRVDNFWLSHTRLNCEEAAIHLTYWQLVWQASEMTFGLTKGGKLINIIMYILSFWPIKRLNHLFNTVYVHMLCWT